MYLLHIAVISLFVAACPADNMSKGLTKRLIIFKRIIDCEDQGLGTWTASVNLVKSGRKYFLNGNCTWPIDLDEKMKFRLSAALFKDGQYHNGYLDIVVDGCQQFEHLSNGFLTAFFRSSGIEEDKNQCPYPKGTYNYKNFQMESNPTMPNNIPNGQYKLSVYVIDAKENVMGCATSYIDIKLNDDRKQNN